MNMLETTGLAISCAVLTITVSCGNLGGSGGSGGTPAVEVDDSFDASRPVSMAIASADDLPECGDDNQSQLVYIISDTQFYVCDSDWTEIDISGSPGNDGVAGPAGMAIGNIWRFHTDDLSGSADVCEESLFTNATIGTVQAVRFTNGSSFYSVSIHVATVDDAFDVYDYDVGHSFYVEDAKTDTDYVTKFGTSIDFRMQYRVRLTDSISSFNVKCDSDGNFDDDSFEIYQLTKQ